MSCLDKEIEPREREQGQGILTRIPGSVLESPELNLLLNLGWKMQREQNPELITNQRNGGEVPTQPDRTQGMDSH